MTWPLALHPTLALLGHPDVDVWNHAWGPWWWSASLGAGELPWHTTLLRAPMGGTLWFIDPLLAFLGAPLVGWVGVVGTWNLLLFASVLLTSVATGRFVRTLGGSGAGPWVGSAAAASTTAVTCALHNGISEALHLGPVALAFTAVEGATRRSTGPRWALAGAAIGLTAVVSPYYGLATGLICLLRVSSVRSPAALWAVPPLLLTALPTTALLAVQLGAEDAIIRRPGGMNAALALHNAVDPRAFFVPGFQSVDLGEEGFVHLAYLGLTTLLLAGAARHAPGARRWLAGAGVCLLLALGPWLYWEADWVRIAGYRVPLPWLLLQRTTSEASTHSLRLAAPVAILLAGLAGLGAARLRRWAFLVPPVVLLDNLAAAPWPLPTAPSAIPAVYADLVRAPAAEDGILDLPTDAGLTMATSRYLYWQTAHGRRIPYTPDARASTTGLSFDPFFQVLAAQCRRRPDEDARLGFDRVPLRIVDPHSLRAVGIRWVILHGELDPPVTGRLLALLEQLLGEGERFGADYRWELGAGSGPRGRTAGPADAPPVPP